MNTQATLITPELQATGVLVNLEENGDNENPLGHAGQSASLPLKAPTLLASSPFPRQMALRASPSALQQTSSPSCLPVPLGVPIARQPMV